MTNGLGIDIGSTTIKVCVVLDRTVVYSHKVVHGATTLSSQSMHKQDPTQILTTLDQCLKHLSEKNFLREVLYIHVTGQMHGVLLWKRRPVATEVPGVGLMSIYHALIERASNLITWQDQRCEAAFLNQFPPSSTFCKVSTGFGIASMVWLQKEYDNLKEFDMCGTIMDFVVWLLTETDEVMMTSHNANSWGYFDIHDNTWMKKSMHQLNIPLHLLPKIVPISDPVGQLRYPLHGLDTNVLVFPSLGDMQCSISAVSPSTSSAVLNIGTSSQLSFIADYQYERMKNLIDTYPAVTVVPYKGCKVIVTAASLSGGNVMNALVENLRSWMIDLGCNDIPSTESMFTKLQGAASKHDQSDFTAGSCLLVNPTMFGERHNPTSTASVGNINSSNCTLGSMVCSIYRGLIQNLFHMLPVEILKEFGVERISVTGSLGNGNDVLLKHVADFSGLEIVSSCETEGAAFGAVIFSCLNL